ncbi:pyroglutamyl-peptidase I [Cellulomonas cellasea]|uniref:Pyrrolidone-carboxylate peptidase n=2 Tax=Cellulomonas cellasea TaxID=43670 RepID=A0A0A0BCQ8_9CELL|nr:pyroglutamyl-peptidase I [Cellulomonas cellasea]KGM03948.1 pyrrolidone-carboxylate peptidase [Cellulomonas cellasea DSM 20118]GEA89030.1 pyrrolidone-carboxylate peptidase [Cellulomonas cellasea]
MTTVLLTAFEPFDGQTVNASQEVVRRVEAAWDVSATLVVRVLPVSFRRARQELRTAVAELEPDVVVCVGEAGGRGAVGVERVAVNVIDARIPDADGSAPVDVPVIAGAPAAFFSTLPVKACWAAAREAGAPAEVSGTAGTYVCNATFYALQHLLGGREGVRSGFVHVPRLPEQVGAGEPALAADVAARGLLAVLRAAVETSTDVRVAAGSLA